MKITNLGGATAIVEHDGKRMLFDPWMDDGILYGSWYHYPPMEIGPEQLGHLDYVYISHIHEDHCSPGTIKHINRDAEIILMDREPEHPNFVAKFLAANDFHFKKVHRIRPKTPTLIAEGLVVDFVEADPANEYNFQIDSGLIMKWGDKVLYNANDCPPYPGGLDYIKKTYGTVDLALLSYSGGSGYPGCYSNLSHEEKMKEKARIAEAGKRMFVDAVRHLEPKRALPFADQYVIAGSRSHLNKYSPHPPCSGSVQEFLRGTGYEDRLLLLNPSQSFDLETEKKVPDAPYFFRTEEDRETYIRKHLTDRKYDHELVSFRDVVPVKRLFEYARNRLWNAQNRQSYFPTTTLLFELTDWKQTFQIDLDREGVEEVSYESEVDRPFIKMRGSSTLFSMMLLNHISWNMADGALFIDYVRKPNTYDPKVYALINLLTV